MSTLSNGDINNISRRADVNSLPHRQNYSNLKNAINDNQNQINNIATPPAGSEVTNARDGEDSLQARIRGNSDAYGNKHITGFSVIEQDTPNMTVKVTAGRVIVGGVGVNRGITRAWSRAATTITVTDQNHGLSNGVTVDVTVSSATTPLPLGDYVISNVTTNTFDVTGVDSGDTSGTCTFSRSSGTITSPTTNPRFDVVVVNSDQSLSVVTGTEAVVPIFPAIATTQYPIAFITLTAATATITESIITACLGQGVTTQDGVWSFTIQEAVDNLPSTGGTLTIAGGNYYENIDITLMSDIRIIGNNKPTLHLMQGTGEIFDIKNVIGTPQDNILISGLILNGGSVTGNTSLFDIEYTDNVSIIDIESDGNINSSLSDDLKIVEIINSTGFIYTNNKAVYSDSIAVGSGVTKYLIDSNDTIITDRPIVGDIDITGDVDVSGGINTEGGSEPYLKTKVIEFSGWDMTAATTHPVTHGLTFTKIRSVTAIIRNDANTTYRTIDHWNTSNSLMQGGVDDITSLYVKLSRYSGGEFDSISYDSMGVRGWVTIIYEA